LVSGGIALRPLRFASIRAAGRLGRTLHCLEPTPTPAAAAKRFLFAAGAGLAISGARPFDDPRIALDHQGTKLSSSRPSRRRPTTRGASAT